MEKLKEEFANEVEEFIGKAVRAGYETAVEGMDASSTVTASNNIREHLVEFFGFVTKDVPDDEVEERVMQGRKYLELFSITGRYDISKRGKVTPLDSLMHILVESEHDGLFNTETFAYAMQEVAQSVFMLLDGEDCQDPSFLKQKAQFDAHQSEKVDMLDMLMAMMDEDNY